MATPNLRPMNGWPATGDKLLYVSAALPRAADAFFSSPARMTAMLPPLSADTLTGKFVDRQGILGRQL